MINVKAEVEKLPITRKNEYVSEQWVKHLESFRSHIKHDRIDEFMMWSTTKATMQIGGVDWYVNKALANVKGSAYSEMYDPAYSEKFTGVYEQAHGTNGNRIIQLAHIHEYNTKSGRFFPTVSDKTVLEIGGGYGTMADIVYRLGFEGEYNLVDLPELTLLQRYYLSNVQPGNFDKMRFYQMHEGRFDVLPEKVDMLIAIASLSEVPLMLRTALLGMVEFSHALILFQQEFFNVDNMKYFTELAEKRGGSIYPSPYFAPTHFYYIL